MCCFIFDLISCNLLVARGRMLSNVVLYCIIKGIRRVGRLEYVGLRRPIVLHSFINTTWSLYISVDQLFLQWRSNLVAIFDATDLCFISDLPELDKLYNLFQRSVNNNLKLENQLFRIEQWPCGARMLSSNPVIIASCNGPYFLSAVRNKHSNIMKMEPREHCHILCKTPRRFVEI